MKLAFGLGAKPAVDLLLNAPNWSRRNPDLQPEAAATAEIELWCASKLEDEDKFEEDVGLLGILTESRTDVGSPKLLLGKQPKICDEIFVLHHKI